MTERAVVQVTLWQSPYLGSFMAGQLHLAAAVRERLGLATHLVLDGGAAGRPWLADLDAAGVSWSLLPAGRRTIRRHLDGVLAERGGALVHAHFTGADLPAAAAARRAGVPCVWQMHTGFDGYALAQRAKDLVKVRVVARRRVDRVVTVSPWLARLAERRGVPGERIATIPNGIDAERFAGLPHRSAARARLGLPAGADVVLAFAWWPEAKGADVALDALERLARHRPRLVALLVGEQRLRDLVEQRLGAPPPWLRISPFVEDVAELFAAADVFVSASRHEGQSYAAGEALAAGVPVVLSRIGGTAMYEAAPGVRTFPSGEPAAMARALDEVLRRPAAERRALAAGARAWTAARLGLEPWCAQLCGLYAELVRATAPRSTATSRGPTAPSAVRAAR